MCTTKQNLAIISEKLLGDIFAAVARVRCHLTLGTTKNRDSPPMGGLRFRV